MGWVDIIFHALNKHRQLIQILFGLLVGLLIVATESQAQSLQGFIYGHIYTRDNTYSGQIRWGREEAYWLDHFNAAKSSRRDSRYRDRNRDWTLDWRLSSIWEDRYSSTTHQFSCQFGDIDEIEVLGDKQIILTLKNGAELELNGSGYNDIETNLNILDKEIGHLSVKWSSIRRIEFLSTPSTLTRYYGAPLFGTVETIRKGTFTGLIQWDHDERLGKDILDGETRDGDVEIEFSRIRSIEREGRGSIVILKTDREFYLTNSNDVNSENRGIIVMVDGVGNIDIPWEEFRKVTFQDNASSGPSYDSFKPPVGLKGRVRLFDDEELRGDILFDIDEKWEVEILEGMDDELEYNIPFKYIKKITPKNYDYSMVELRNGDQLLLGRMRDISDENDGLLIFVNENREPRHIPWRRILDIEFD